MRYNESQTVAWLLEEASQSTPIAQEELCELLHIIQAPLNLYGLFLVVHNLVPILEAAKAVYEINTDSFPKLDLPKAIQTCSALIQIEDTIVEHPALGGLALDTHVSTWQQLCGIIESNPLYACLCFKPKNQQSVLRYLQLQAQTLLTAHCILESGASLTQYTDQFLSVRKLSESKFSAQLSTLPELPVSFSSYVSSLNCAALATPARNISTLFQAALAPRKKIQASTKIKAEPNQSKVKPRIGGLDDHDNSAKPWTGENFAPRGVLSNKESQNYSDLGGSPAEFTGGQDHVPVPLANERNASGPTLLELAFQGKQRSNQEAIKNQLNPMGWNELNQFDVYILLKFLYDETGETRPDNSDIQFIRDCISLMFWLSSPLERILRLKRYNGAPTAQSQEGLYYINGQSLVARLYSPGPKLESQNIGQSELAHPVDHYSCVPLPGCAHTKSLINDCRLSRPAPLPHRNYHEQDDHVIDSLTRQIKNELGRLNSTHGTRLSIGRISRHLLHALSTEQGEDPPSAMLFFGRQEKFSVARLHYTCAPVQRMETNYRRICSGLLGTLGMAGGYPGDDLVNGAINLGTPFCPRPEVIKNLVKSLLQAIRQTRPSKKNLYYVRHFHAQYALYTACMIAFSTTYRAVRDPSLYEEDIHFASGLGVISDKDDATFYHSRFVWLSPVCRQQVINYRRHLQRIYELFAFQSPGIFDLFKQHDLHGRPLSLFVFPQNDNEQLQELRPAIIELLLKKNHGYDLPANANRHYLKTELFESGCPIEVIEAQLGHWEQGQEPWNRFSNLHPLEFCQQLEKHLSPILHRDGWRAVEGITL